MTKKMVAMAFDCKERKIRRNNYRLRYKSGQFEHIPQCDYATIKNTRPEIEMNVWHSWHAHCISPPVLDARVPSATQPRIYPSTGDNTMSTTVSNQS